MLGLILANPAPPIAPDAKRTVGGLIRSRATLVVSCLAAAGCWWLLHPLLCLCHECASVLPARQAPSIRTCAVTAAPPPPQVCAVSLVGQWMAEAQAKTAGSLRIHM